MLALPVIIQLVNKLHYNKHLYTITKDTLGAIEIQKIYLMDIEI